MAVWLTMDMSYVGAGDQTNTSKVAVNVYVHWDTKSYNGLSPTLNVTVDGVNDTVNVSFNTSQTSSGSQNIYSRYWNIGHDSSGSARTVYGSASYATGTASGTVGASTSLALDAIGGSGGDSGGDSGGGDSGGDEYTYTFHYIIGEHCTVERYWGTLQDTVTESKSQTLSSSTLNGYTFVFKAEDGYTLSGCSVNGTACDDDGECYIVAYSGEYTIIASAVPNCGIFIDSDTGYSLYECYIDTEYAEYPINNVSCTIVGQKTAWEDENSWGWYTYSDEARGPSWGARRQNASSIFYNVYYLKFTVPELNNTPKRLTINIKMQQSSYYPVEDGTPVNYALCTSDANHSLYIGTISAVNDQYQIATGTFNQYLGDGAVNTIIIETDNLQSNTSYYLIIWDAKMESTTDEYAYTMTASNHTITLTCEDRSKPAYYSKFEKYIPYIDNGTSWEALNGTNAGMSNYTNQIPISTDVDGSIYNGLGYMAERRINSSGNIATLATSNATNPIFVTGFIPVKSGDVIRMKNCFIDVTEVENNTVYGQNGWSIQNAFYDSSKSQVALQVWTDMANGTYTSATPDSNGHVTQFTVRNLNTGYMRICLAPTVSPVDAILTVNQEII